MRFFIIVIFVVLTQFSIKSQNPSSLDSLEGTRWVLISIDSAGNILNFPNAPSYFISFNNFENPKWEYKRKYKKAAKKNGYKEMAVFTEESNRYSKYFCQIRALYKISSYNLLYKFTSYWNDSFKVQEHLSDVGDKYLYWMYKVLNGQGSYKFTGTGVDIFIWKFKDEYVTMTLHLERLK
jgi:hypothetical protein